MHQRLLWFYLRIRPILELVIDWIGKHPLIIIVFPSIWLFIRYKPFWKDVDVVAQLIAAPGSLNILHCPPIYCFLARLPFWLTDTLTHGTAPPIFSEQHPSLLAVRALIFFQHVGLWFALRYLLFSVGWSDISRGIAAVLQFGSEFLYVCPYRGVRSGDGCHLDHRLFRRDSYLASTCRLERLDYLFGCAVAGSWLAKSEWHPASLAADCHALLVLALAVRAPAWDRAETPSTDWRRRAGDQSKHWRN